MLPIPENNLACALLSLAVFAYLELTTFFSGFALLPVRAESKRESYWQVIAAWLLGFTVLTLPLIVLGSFKLITPLSLLLLHLLLWCFIFLRRTAVREHARSTTAEVRLWLRDMAGCKLLLPIIVLTLILFVCALVPPTKSDELSYHLYLTIDTLRHSGFTQLLSPFEVLASYLAVSIYNIHPLALGAEYTPALCSVFYYLMSQFVLFRWIESRFNTRAAVLCLLVVFSSPLLFVVAMAPGDNSLNILLLLCFSLLAYDLISVQEHIRPKFALLAFIGVIALLVKSTSVLLTVPLFCVVLWTLLKRANLTLRDLLRLAPLGLLLLPSLLRNKLLYDNPIFPLWYESIGDEPFQPGALERGFQASAMSPIGLLQDVGGLLVSPFYYISNELRVSNPNPFFWLLLLSGFYALIKKGYIAYAAALVVSYCLAFFLLPHYAVRFYFGAAAFLIALGIAEIDQALSAKKRAAVQKWLSVCVVAVATILSVALLLYSKQYLYAFFTNENRDSFLKPRVEAYETIAWANENLPKNASLLVTTRQRYYYQHRTEFPYPTIYGHHIQVEEDCKLLREVLKQNGTTHVVVVYWGSRAEPTRKQPLMECVKDANFATAVYHNPREIVRGHRRLAPITGESVIYQLR